MDREQEEREFRSQLTTSREESLETFDEPLPPPQRPQKRKTNNIIEAPRLKKAKTTIEPGSGSPKSQPKISVTLKLGPRPAESEPLPCCLCVSTSKDGLLRVQDPPIARKEILEAAGNPTIWMAHELCASIVPETWVDVSIRQNGSTEKVIHGVSAIVKDRWNLVSDLPSRAV